MEVTAGPPNLEPCVSLHAHIAGRLLRIVPASSPIASFRIALSRRAPRPPRLLGLRLLEAGLFKRMPGEEGATLRDPLPTLRRGLEAFAALDASVLRCLSAALLAAARRTNSRTCGMDGMGWDGMGWDRMGWDGMGWDGMGWDGMGWGGMGWDGVGWDGMGWDWTVLRCAVLDLVSVCVSLGLGFKAEPSAIFALAQDHPQRVLS